MAFQLHDDLQDAFGDPVSTGKPVGEDLREGRPTYLVAVARERCEAAGDRAGTRVLDEVVGARCEAAEADVRRAREVLDASGAREQVAAQVERLCHRSEEVLAGAPLERAAAARLVRLLRGACGRTGDGERSRAVASAAEPGLGTVAAFDDMPAGGPR